VGDWSQPVGGLRARLELRSEAGGATDTPMAHTWVVLENVSDVGNPMELYWDDDHLFSFTLTDDTGAPARTGGMAASIMSPGPYWLVIPFESSVRASLTVMGYGVQPHGRLFIGLPAMHAWELDAGDAHAYQLAARLRVTAPPPADHRQAWSGELDIPPVALPAAAR
jgi:hypothetical protein